MRENRMRILIADDEYYARKALVKKVRQAVPEAEIAGDFENGVQVLEYLEEHPGAVDVILTDVKMPEMDGLHLAQYIFEEELQAEVIIVSGYNEFEYAKKAISFGVSSYLVKPVQMEELREALGKIRRSRERYEAQIRSQMVKHTLKYLSIEEISNHEEWKKQFMDPVFEQSRGKPFFLAVVQPMDGMKAVEVRELERQLTGLQRRFLGEWFFFEKHREYVLILFGEKKEITDRLDFFVRQTEKNGEFIVSAGLSMEHRVQEECVKAYQEAVYAINQRLVEGWSKLYIFSADIKPENLLTKDKEQFLESAITGHRCGQAETVIRELLETCRNSYTLYVTISSIFNLLYRIFCRNSSDEREGRHGYMLFSYKSDLYGFYTLDAVEKYVLQIVKSVCQEQEEKKHHYIVQEILGDIEKNYQDNISLSELAEHKYFMNSSYLSRLFKNEMGQTFSGYLMEFRIRKAAELLKSTMLKISDIAMLSGYNDVSHFIQYFKKIYSCTPEEYRGRN